MTARKLALALGGLGLALLFWRSNSSPRAVDESRPAPTAEEPAPSLPTPPNLSDAVNQPAPTREPVVPATAEPRKTLSRLGEATLWVEVVSQDTGRPMADVELVVTKAGVESFSGEGVGPLEGRLRKFPRTGADGRARFRLPPGAYLLRAFWGEARRHQGKKEFDIAELADGEERTQRIELPTDNDLRYLGRALDELSGAPLAGAEVLLFEGNSWGSSWPLYQSSGVIAELARVTTDSSGSFELWSASWKHTMVRVRATGHCDAYAAVEPGHSEPGTEVVLRIRGGADLIARVEQAGAPMQGIHVSLSLERGWIRGGDTDATGSCTFTGVPAGIPLTAQLAWPEPEVPEAEENADAWFGAPFPYQRLEQRLPTEITLVPGETRTETWQLAPRCTLRGIAREQNGKIAPGLMLHLRRNYDDSLAEPVRFGKYSEKFPDLLQTDERGAFEIPALPSGTSWWLGPDECAGDYRDVKPIGVPVVIPEGTTELWVDLEIQREG